MRALRIVTSARFITRDLAVLLVALVTTFGDPVAAQVWDSNLPDGPFRNSIVFADYAVPDVVTAGDNYHAASFTSNSVAPVPPLTFTVDQDGGADYTTVQAAFDAVPEQYPEPITVKVMNGVYDEKIILTEGKINVTLVGESRDSTILTHDDYSGKVVGGDTLGTSTSYTVAINADDFTARDITFENTYDGAQAVAVSVRGDRVVFYNVRMLGNQDTYYAHNHSRIYHKDCYIEGTTDFIFGGATAVFEDCHIHSKKESYITAASTPEGAPFGFVFIDCRLTAAPGVEEVYLGRPWRDYAKTVFIGTEMGPHIRPAGWHNWSKPEAEATVFYAEHGNTGPGADRSERVAWSHELTEEEAAKYTAEYIFGAGRTTSEDAVAWYERDGRLR